MEETLEYCEQHTNAVNVFIDAPLIGAWEVKIDHVHHVLDIETARRYSGSDKNGSLSRTECRPDTHFHIRDTRNAQVKSREIYLHSIFTLPLSTSGVNRSAWKAPVV
jgi:hypothetical protein